MADEVEKISIRDFFEGQAPGEFGQVSDLGSSLIYPSAGGVCVSLNLPEITLHCDSEHCGGVRLFSSSSTATLTVGAAKNLYVVYRCKNCSGNPKTFALLAMPERDLSGHIFKYGEFPHFGPPTPARLSTLVGPDRDMFLKGRRSENQGLGIAAFAYYRRVVERQKDRIFDEVVRVCKRIGAGQNIVDELTAAKNETQFTKAIDMLKHGIPQVLLINGQNPLTLLHGALSEGLHAESDEDCLQWATVIRVVMAALAERMGQALKDEAELNTAVSKLIQKKVKPALTDKATS